MNGKITLILLLSAAFEVNGTSETHSEGAVLPAVTSLNPVIDGNIDPICDQAGSACCRGHANTGHRGCSCDVDCHYNGNCCCDATFFYLVHRPDSTPLCISPPGSKAFYKMIVRCSSSEDTSQEDKETARQREDKEKCESPTGADSSEFIPVTSVARDFYVTYRNIYCARCNSVHGELSVWEYHSNCTDHTHGEKKQSDEFQKDKKCDNFLIKPGPSLVHRVRTCYNETFVDQCPQYNRLCESGPQQSITIRKPNSSDVVIYNNEHCVECHGADLKDAICLVKTASLGLSTSTQETETEVLQKSSVRLWKEISLCASIVFLILLIRTVVRVTELHNVAGYRLVFLCLAQIGAYASTVVFDVLNVSLYENSHISLQLTLFYFYVSSTVWMLTMAYTVCRALRSPSVTQILFESPPWKRFILHSMVTWCWPTGAFYLFVFSYFKKAYEQETDTTVVAYAVGYMVTLIGPNIIIMAFIAMGFIYVALVTSMSYSGDPRVKLGLNILFFVMTGVSGSVYVICKYDSDPTTGAYLFTFINFLMWLFLFYIFTMTSHVRRGLSNKFECFEKLDRMLAFLTTLPLTNKEALRRFEAIPSNESNFDKKKAVDL